MKKIIQETVKFTYFGVCFWVVFSSHAHAYIDPSAVTYVIQAVAGVLIAVGAALTIFRHKIVAFFRRSKKGDSVKEADKIEFKEVDD